MVLGSKDPELRNSDASSLLNYAFSNFSLCRLRQDKPLPSLPIEMGSKEQLSLGYGGEEFALIPKGNSDLSYKLMLPQKLSAPNKAG